MTDPIHHHGISSWPKKILSQTLGLVAAGIVLFEEFVWKAIAQAARELANRLPLKRLEAHIRTLSPPFAAACFLLPVLLLLPIKIVGLTLIAHGHALSGTLVFISGKVLGTAVAARIFDLTEPALRQVLWLARAIDAVLEWKEKVRAWAKRQPVVIVVKQNVKRFRAWLKLNSRSP